jgi:hypothetical protein
MPSSRHEEIKVQLIETDGIDGVFIIKNNRDEISRGRTDNRLVRKEQP